MEKIDFILTWIDSNDPDWQAEKAMYQKTTEGDTRAARYRDWDTLRYWFRGIEKFAPWVNNIFFVTWGHLPGWLETSNSKLKIIKHTDYIPQKYLPTFSSRAIDMNFHHIVELSEHFVYFNDDMYLINPVKETDFFRNGLPCEIAILNALCLEGKGRNGEPYKLNNLYTAPYFNMALINRNFDKKSAIRDNVGKWYSLKYWPEGFRTLLLGPWKYFPGFRSTHLPYSYLKSTYKEAWDKEEEFLNIACEHRFREITDVNHWVFNYWQIASGNFEPRPFSLGRLLYMSNDEKNNEQVYKILLNRKYKMVCINDEVTNETVFREGKKQLLDCFDKLLPDKSAFEK